MEQALKSISPNKEVFTVKKKSALIADVKAGDKHAFKLLYQQHIGRVYALCYRMTGEKNMAEDAAQEVFIQLWRKIANYDGNSQFSTWLHSVTANVTISYMRKQRGWFQRMLNIELSGGSEPVAPQQPDNEDLEKHIRALPERARLVFVLHAVEGYRHEEIAKMLNMAVGSSKAQLHRAKGLLKHAMGYKDE